MPRYHVTLTDTEIQELKSLIQKGGKGYRRLSDSAMPRIYS